MLNRTGIAFGLVFLVSGASLVFFAAPENDLVSSVLAFLAGIVLLEGAAIIAIVVKNWWSFVKLAPVKERRYVVCLHMVHQPQVRPPSSGLLLLSRSSISRTRFAHKAGF